MNATLARRTGCRPFDFERADERAAMGHLLGLIVEDDQRREPTDPPLMLSALVIYLNANDAGSGFYQLAKEQGLLSVSASADERLVFWAGQLKRIRARYAVRA
ncbi:hypothetical protein BJP40_24945 [Streptomyces sp. CC53]|nr:hypothetical protein BJP40_24945 [Streptomyces sp. CC53]OII69134.1 hypothetical protein BJP39_04400 [Streptomyces sp. CC77]